MPRNRYTTCREPRQRLNLGRLDGDGGQGVIASGPPRMDTPAKPCRSTESAFPRKNAAMAGKRNSKPSIEGRRIGTRRTGAARRATGSDFLAGGGEMGGRIREHDWPATPLGPVETWPQSLWSAVSILLPSRAQVVLFWGPEFIAIYNDAYAPVFGAKHPWALGRPARECWSEVWPVLGPLFEGVVRTGEAFWARRPPLPAPPPGIPRRDVLRRLVRPGSHRGRQRRRRLLHRQRADRARPRRAPPSDPEGARREDGGCEERRGGLPGGGGRAGDGPRRCSLLAAVPVRCFRAPRGARRRLRGRARRPRPRT